MNKRGVVLTLSAFIIAVMILTVSIGVGEVSRSENSSFNFIIATEQALFMRENALRMTKSVYQNTGQINWSFNDNNFIYSETFPDSAGKTAISTNLTDLNNFFNSFYQPIFSYRYENIDLGTIQIYDKGFTVAHSLTTGFGANNNIYFTASSINYNVVEIDMNVYAALNQGRVDNSLTVCGGCSNYIFLRMTVIDVNTNTELSFNDFIDLDSTNYVGLDTPDVPGGADDIQVNIDGSGFTFYSEQVLTEITAKTVFDTDILEVGLDRAIMDINSPEWYRITG